MKNKKWLMITAVIILIAVVAILLLLTGILNQKEIPSPSIPSPSFGNSSADNNLSLTRINSSLSDFPPEIQGEIQTLSDTYSIEPGYWGFDPFNNEIDLLERDIPDASSLQALSGKKTGNYTIHIFNKTELMATESEVQSFIRPLMFTDDYRITNSMTGGDFNGRPSVDLECDLFTPENRKLENLMFKGWRIHVNVCCGVAITPPIRD